LKVLDLFSGIGGFSLGLHWAGMETIAFCEADDKCRQVLKKHWPDIPVHEDIKKLDGKQYRGTASVVCGGFPCQPWSVAGRRKGHDDNRDLWPEMLRIIREVKPRWVIGENVQGFVNKEMGLARTATDLENEGFETRNFLLPACGVSAPHQRFRIFVVGYAKQHGSSSAEKCGDSSSSGINSTEGKNQAIELKGTGGQGCDGNMAHSEQSGLEGGQRNDSRGRREILPSIEHNGNEVGSKVGCSGGSSGEKGKKILADTESIGTGKSRVADKKKRFKKSRKTQSDLCGEDVAHSEGVGHRGGDRSECGFPEWKFQPKKHQGRTVGSEVEGCRESHGETLADTESGQPRLKETRNGGKNTGGGSETWIGEWWAVEPNVGRVAHGVRGRVDRLKQLGNSVVPQLIRQIGESILKAEG